MKYKDIAAKYGVSISAVKSWANRYWKDAPNKKSPRPKTNRVATKQSIKKKMFISVDANKALTEKRRLFCVYYATSYNALQSYLKAYGGNKDTARVEGCKLLTDPNIKAEVKRLRDILRTGIDVGIQDLLRYCLKVVNADIGDYVAIRGGRHIVLTDSIRIDTSLIDEIKETNSGVAIKLADKKWAWEKIEKYLGFDESAKLQVNLQNEKLQAEIASLNKSDGKDAIQDHNENIQALADLLQHPVPDRHVEEFEKSDDNEHSETN
ncbi:terminase small subunit [Megasphaera cerevisiae]|nr:terminase small subunit [Megasphaera cerevisiae]